MVFIEQYTLLEPLILQRSVSSLLIKLSQRSPGWAWGAMEIFPLLLWLKPV